MSLIPTWVKALAALAVTALIFGAGWYVRSNIAEADISALTAGYDKAAADASEKARKDEHKMADTVAQLDTREKELTDAKHENDTLRHALETGGNPGGKRVYVRATCPASSGLPAAAGSPGVDDGSGYAQLDPKTASDMAGITGDGDSEILKLNSLQEYVRSVCLAPR